MYIKAIVLSLLLIPTPLTAFTLVLDPGHGGEDEGIRRGDLVEKSLALRLCQEIKTAARSKEDFHVILTRKGDYALSFDERRRIANAAGADAFLSIHFAGAPDAKMKGSRMYLLREPTGATPSDLIRPLNEAHTGNSIQSLVLSGALKETLEDAVGNVDTQIFKLPLAPILGIVAPAILLEVDYLTSQDAFRWKEPQILRVSAKRILEAIDRFRGEGKNANL